MAAMGAAVCLASAMMAFPASAHGHGRGHHRRSGDYYQSQTTENQAGTGNQAAGSQTAVQCPVCTVEDCVEVGRHWHDDLEYCGYHHTSGYCDYSCVNNCEVETTGSGTGVSGCHHCSW